MVPPTQTRPVIASLIRDLSGLARRTTWSDTSKDGSSATNTTDVNTQPTSSARLGLGPVLDPTKILPSFHHAHDFSPHISTDDRAGEKPDGYVRPDKLIVKSSAREKYGAWMDEAVGYHDRGGRGEGVKERSDREPGLGLHKRVALPDVFSTVRSRFSYTRRYSIHKDQRLNRPTSLARSLAGPPPRISFKRQHDQHHPLPRSLVPDQGLRLSLSDRRARTVGSGGSVVRRQV